MAIGYKEQEGLLSSDQRGETPQARLKIGGLQLCLWLKSPTPGLLVSVLIP